MPLRRLAVFVSFSLQTDCSCDDDVSPSRLQPMDYQQTLRKSFTVGGIGLHTGEYGVWPGATQDRRWVGRGWS